MAVRTESGMSSALIMDIHSCIHHVSKGTGCVQPQQYSDTNLGKAVHQDSVQYLNACSVSSITAV